MTQKTLKDSIRRETLSRRDAMGEVPRAAASLAMVHHGGEAIDIHPGEIVSGFWPIRSEADIRPLMTAFQARGARLCLPAVLDRETIVFREVLPDAPIVKTGFGTTGPGADAPLVDPSLLLIPLAAFDAVGNRIGYGAGHYDRAIARLRAKGLNPRLIGIAFDCQEVASVPAEPHDVALDALLSESGLRLLK